MATDCDDAVIRGPLAPYGEVEVSDDKQVDRFDFSYVINPKLFITTLGAMGGAASVTNAQALLTTSGMTPSFANVRSVKTYGPHLGQVLEVEFSAIFSLPGLDDTKQLVGWGDSDYGFFFGMVGSLFGIVKRESSVDVFVPIDNFNSDKLNFNGESGMKLITNKLNTYKIQYQLDGSGQASFFVLNPATNRYVLAHRIVAGGVVLSPAIPRPYLPIGFEVYSNSSAGSVTLSVSSMTASVFGTDISACVYGTFSSPERTVGASPSALTPLLVVQNLTTYASFANKLPVFIRKFLVSFRVISGSGHIATIALAKNGTLSGVSFSGAPAGSHVQGDTSITAIGGDAEILFLQTDFVEAIRKEITLPEAILLKAGDTLALGVRSDIAGLSAFGSIEWDEAP